MSGQPARPGETGFTLVEMLVSLLIFGIIAGIATAMATGATRSFAASQGALGTVTALDDTRTILAADLGQAARRPSLSADGKPMPAFILTPDGFVLTRYRDGASRPAIEKVAWGQVDGRLLRQPFPAIDGAAPGEATVMAEGLAGDPSYPTKEEDFKHLIRISSKVQVENESDWFAKFKAIMQG